MSDYYEFQGKPYLTSIAMLRLGRITRKQYLKRRRRALRRLTRTARAEVGKPQPVLESQPVNQNKTHT